jgi:hypothetical protein
VFGAFLTWRQINVGREGQSTDRFVQAIGQLGSDQVDVRIGGVYALERVARTFKSELDRGAMAEVLSAFVRTHAPMAKQANPSPSDQQADSEELPILAARAPDVQAVMTVLGRGEILMGADSAIPLQLESVDLSNAYLFQANLGPAQFRRASLKGANLIGANLKQSDLRQVDLRQAHLQWTQLQGADIREAKLQGADLRGAFLGGSNLDGAELYGADLSGAKATSETTWPEGFNPGTANVIVERN